MAIVKILAGDFPKGSAKTAIGALVLPWQFGDGFWGKSVKFDTLESVEIASEESVKRFGGTLGWGLVGGALFGPIGLLAGALTGGRGKDVTFVAKFKDGKKMLATTNAKTFNEIQAYAF